MNALARVDSAWTERTRGHVTRRERVAPIRQWLFLGLLLLQGLSLVGLIVAARSNTEVLQVDYAKAVMQHLSENVLDKIQRFLSPAEQAARVTVNLIESDVLDVRNQSRFETYLLEQLRVTPHLTGMYLGRSDGSFLFARRESTGFSVKTIGFANQKRRVQVAHFDSDLEPTRTETFPNDTYDPRSRPWYKQALERGALIWTGPYVFFTSQKPGITTALPARRANGDLIGVVGVDIEITALSKFIGAVPTSAHGAAFIVTKNEEVVGMPGLESSFKPGSKSLPQLVDVGTPSARALHAKFASVQRGDNPFTSFRINQEEYVGLLRPLPINDDSYWWLGIHAPKNDFVGSTNAMFNRQLTQTLLILLLVCLAAIPLVMRVSNPIEGWYKRATTDDLTSLLNRTEFLRQTNRAILDEAKQKRSGVLVMLDLDGFKGINDRFGHDAGDHILRTVAAKMRSVLRPQDLLGRLGGDEFAMYLPNLELQAAEHLLNAWRLEIVKPFQGSIGLSVGLATVASEDKVLERLHCADQALIQAKASGKNRVVTFGLMAAPS
jgi:diguanylate cyclase (GGDEF)-like protein